VPDELKYSPTSTHKGLYGGTEAINLIIEKIRRLAHGFRKFDHYRLRILLAADGQRPTEEPTPMLDSEDRFC
jgi:hypothetical protein